MTTTAALNNLGEFSTDSKVCIYKFLFCIDIYNIYYIRYINIIQLIYNFVDNLKHTLFSLCWISDELQLHNEIFEGTQCVKYFKCMCLFWEWAYWYASSE